jgi:hypothetical protein
MVPHLSAYLREVELARLFAKGRFAADQDRLQAMSLRGRQAWAQTMQHVDALTEMFRDADRRRAEAEMNDAVIRAKTTSPEFRKSLRELDLMYRALPRRLRAVARPVVEDQKPSGGEVISKAFGMLQNDASLNAEQRGRLMLGLSHLADGVAFAKAEPATHSFIARAEVALAAVRRAIREKKIGARGEAMLRHIYEEIQNGNIDAGHETALLLLLSELKDEIEKEEKENAHKK